MVRNEDSSHVFDLHVAGAVRAGLGNGNTHPLQRRNERLRGKHGLRAVAGAAQPNHQTIADQLVVANSFNRGHVLDPRKLG
jgi:hypothetical protein